MIKTMSLELSDKARVRLKWMDAYRECGNAAAVCRHFSIPLRTFWRWKRRYDPWDLKSLEDRSRKPTRSPRRTPRERERLVLELKRRHPRWGAAKLALVLRTRQGVDPSAMTVWRILKRHGRIVRYRTRKRKPPKPRVNWAEVRLPGDLLQVDTKHATHLGRKAYQYTAIDVVTKDRRGDIFRTADMATTIRFLEAAVSAFGRKIVMVQTDNGPEFGREVTAWLRRRGIRHVFSHKRRPQENAYVERSHRIDEEEFWSLGGHGATFEDLRRNFAAYLAMYNTERPHWGLGGKTPAEALAAYSLK
jgi:transposase InsO family protein